MKWVVYTVERCRVELERSLELERKWAEKGQPAHHLFFCSDMRIAL